MWLRKHEPEHYARIAHVMLPKDYVRLRLTGERAIDVADASGTLLLDVAQRRWSDEVLSSAGDRRGVAADRARVARGLRPHGGGVAVAAGAGDQAAGGLGVGVDRPGPLSVAMGTSGVVFAALPEYRADPQARVHAFCHAVPGAWHQMGVMLSAAGSLAWLRNVVGGEYPELTAEAEPWGPGAEGLTFLPYLTGERTPHADPDARGAFTGLEIRHDRGALVRARARGRGLRPARLVRPGRAGASAAACPAAARARELWLKIVASVLEIPLERLGRGGGRGLRRGAARRRRGRALERRRTRRSRRACAPIRRCSRSPSGSTRTVSCGSATGRFTRLCRQTQRRHPDDGHVGSDRQGGARPPRAPLHLRALDGRQPRPRPVRRPDARRRSTPSTPCTSSPSSARGASRCTTTT